MIMASRILLTDEERTMLNVWLRLQPFTRLALRAKIILLAADGLMNREIAHQLGTSCKTVSLWRWRFLKGRLAAIEKEAPRRRQGLMADEAVVQMIVQKMKERPADGTRWTTRSLAKELGVSASTVQRVWKARGSVSPLASTPAYRYHTYVCNDSSQGESNMGRPRSIDRDKLLNLAEKIVSKGGPAALTIDAVAQAAGVTKGGVQYCFGTKDQLIEALFRRWLAEFETCVDSLVEGRSDPLSLVRAYVAATRQTYCADNERASVMLALLMQSEGRLEQCRKWYHEQFARMRLMGSRQQRLRIAFFAAEGAFMLRYFGFAKIGDDDWQAIFDSIESVLLK